MWHRSLTHGVVTPAKYEWDFKAMRPNPNPDQIKEKGVD